MKPHCKWYHPPPCRYGAKCPMKPYCKFEHPSLCRYGAKCQNKFHCKWYHPPPEEISTLGNNALLVVTLLEIIRVLRETVASQEVNRKRVLAGSCGALAKRLRDLICVNFHEEDKSLLPFLKRARTGVSETTSGLLNKTLHEILDDSILSSILDSSQDIVTLLKSCVNLGDPGHVQHQHFDKPEELLDFETLKNRCKAMSETGVTLEHHVCAFFIGVHLRLIAVKNGYSNGKSLDGSLIHEGLNLKKTGGEVSPLDAWKNALIGIS